MASIDIYIVSYIDFKDNFIEYPNVYTDIEEAREEAVIQGYHSKLVHPRREIYTKTGGSFSQMLIIDKNSLDI